MKNSVIKFFKTIINYEVNNLLYSTNSNTNTYTEVITKEEYENYNFKNELLSFDIRKDYVENNYKKTSIILKQAVIDTKRFGL